jgi:hypothetical protein
MNKDYWKLKKREQRAKRKEAVTVSTAPDKQVTVDYDRVKFPVKAAWEIAVERAERARKYAAMYPDRVRSSEECFQEVAWQYENEGLKAVLR